MHWDFPMSRTRPIESTIRISDNNPGSLPEAVRVQDLLIMKQLYGAGIFSAFLIICIF